MKIGARGSAGGARSDIETLLVGYCRHLDDGAIDQVVELFLADGELQAMGRRARGHAEIRALLEPAVAPQAPVTQHLLTNVVIDIDKTTATAESDFLVVQRTRRSYEILMAGRYRDRLADETSWRFAERIAIALTAWPAGGADE